MPDAGFLKDSAYDPHSPALFDGNSSQWYTRAELTRCATEFAARLQFSRKSLGFLFVYNDAESLIAYLAALQSGHAVAMLNPELDEGLRAQLIARFQPDFILGPRSLGSQPGYTDAESPHAGHMLLRSTTPNRHEVHRDLSLLISTSGSTGSPKLVRLSWRNLESNALQIIQALHHTEQDRTMVTAPIFNGYGQSVVHTMLLAGGSFTLTRARVVSREFWDAAGAAGCNTIGGTPFFYQSLDRLEINTLNVPLLKKFVQIGGRMPAHLAAKFHGIAQGRGGELHLMYGQAETTARISGLPPGLLPEAGASVGFALTGGQLWIEHEGRECAPMEEGELMYRGPNVMMGYATEAKDLAKGDELGGTVATGDLGYRDRSGLFYITGRKSRFVKIYGWRVSLDEVEQLLAPANVAAIAEGERLVIYAENPGASLESAVDELAGRLHLHRSGFEIRAIDAIPRLSNSKVDYQSLKEACRAASTR
ncbi:MAG TPA: AMP-binding protein [Bryobacteraceae bacterium]|jgi:acyl-CoA synthetase (AMP-forming)/AMP-acid ligase II|nr:AMP-binding protein [Bryobacteraceae bacterium]